MALHTGLEKKRKTLCSLYKLPTDTDWVISKFGNMNFVGGGSIGYQLHTNIFWLTYEIIENGLKQEESN